MTWFLLGLVTFAFALSLGAKMTTSLALVAAGAAWRLVATRPWRPWRALIDLPIVLLGGAGLFLATWWAACAALGMPFWLPFRILDIELRDATSSPAAWRENPRALLDMVSYVALWVSPYLILLFVWAGLARLGDLLLRPPLLLWRWLRGGPAERRAVGRPPGGLRPRLAGGAIAVAYLIKLAASFPKYHISMMPLWAVGIAYLLARFVPRMAVWEPPVYGVVLAGMAGYFVTFVGDRYVLFRGYDFLFPLLVWPAALGFAFLVLGACLGRVYLPRQLAILGVLLTVAWGWGVNQAQARATYSTAYNYGVSGQRETATYLDGILRPEQPFVASRDVAYYTQQPASTSTRTPSGSTWPASTSEGSPPSTAASPATPGWTWWPSSSGTRTSGASPTTTWPSSTRSPTRRGRSSSSCAPARDGRPRRRSVARSSARIADQTTRWG